MNNENIKNEKEDIKIVIFCPSKLCHNYISIFIAIHSFHFYFFYNAVDICQESEQGQQIHLLLSCCYSKILFSYLVLISHIHCSYVISTASFLFQFQLILYSFAEHLVRSMKEQYKLRAAITAFFFFKSREGKNI